MISAPSTLTWRFSISSTLFLPPVIGDGAHAIALLLRDCEEKHGSEEGEEDEHRRALRHALVRAQPGEGDAACCERRQEDGDDGVALPVHGRHAGAWMADRKAAGEPVFGHGATCAAGSAQKRVRASASVRLRSRRPGASASLQSGRPSALAATAIVAAGWSPPSSSL